MKSPICLSSFTPRPVIHKKRRYHPKCIPDEDDRVKFGVTSLLTICNRLAPFRDYLGLTGITGPQPTASPVSWIVYPAAEGGEGIEVVSSDDLAVAGTTRSVWLAETSTR